MCVCARASWANGSTEQFLRPFRTLLIPILQPTNHCQTLCRLLMDTLRTRRPQEVRSPPVSLKFPLKTAKKREKLVDLYILLLFFIPVS